MIFFEVTALELSSIGKRFGPTIALEGVNLSLRQGQVHALIGENGAGKSTLLNILAGSVRAVVARKHGIVLIHQELSLFPHLSVAENIPIAKRQAAFARAAYQPVDT